jgi:hypothetical protein
MIPDGTLRRCSMKIKIDLRKTDPFSWHEWFAWRPVQMGIIDCFEIRWLEKVERRRTVINVPPFVSLAPIVTWEYRPL